MLFQHTMNFMIKESQSQRKNSPQDEEPIQEEENKHTKHSYIVTAIIFAFIPLIWIYTFTLHKKIAIWLHVHDNTLFFSNSGSTFVWMIGSFLFVICAMIAEQLKGFSVKTLYSYLAFVTIMGATLLYLGLNTYTIVDKSGIRTHSFFSLQENKYTWNAVDSVEGYFSLEYDDEKTKNTRATFEYGINLKDGHYINAGSFSNNNYDEKLKQNWINLSSIVDLDTFLMKKGFEYETTIEFSELKWIQSAFNISDPSTLFLQTFVKDKKVGNYFLNVNETCSIPNKKKNGSYVMTCERK